MALRKVAMCVFIHQGEKYYVFVDVNVESGFVMSCVDVNCKRVSLSCKIVPALVKWNKCPRSTPCSRNILMYVHEGGDLGRPLRRRRTSDHSLHGKVEVEFLG